MEKRWRRPRVLLAADHALVLQAICRLVETEFEVVGTVTNGLELLEMAEQLKPELAVVDVEMPDMSGVDACRRAVAKVPSMKVILTRIDIR